MQEQVGGGVGGLGWGAAGIGIKEEGATPVWAVINVYSSFMSYTTTFLLLLISFTLFA